MSTAFLYHRVYNALKARIASGELKPGGKLPGEKELTDAFSVSGITVKKALNMLAEQGLVVRIPGRGTFVRDQDAAASAQAKPQLVGVILEHVASPFGLTMMYELDRLLGQAGLRMVVRFSYCDRARETEEIAFLRTLGVRGLIVMPSHGQNYNPEILKLVLNGFPMILIDKKLDGIDVPSVRTDNPAALRDLVMHLARSGRRRIGLIATAEGNATSTVERRRGFRQGLREAGLADGPECALPFERAPETPEVYEDAVRRIAQYLVRYQAELDAIVCTEYSIVPKLVRAAADLKLELTKRVEVCSVDEDDMAPAGYTFTHMKQDEAAIAERAVALLLERLNAPAHGPAQDVLVPAVFHQKRG
ncbi:MAG: GntR family transcriptional regulator [Christensenellaceae bacterium]|nr:GntR family transcriptional regulator [Christensenellaceae bacterium]